MAAVQVIPVPVVMCNVFGQQVFPVTFPGTKGEVGIIPQQALFQVPQGQQQLLQQPQQQLPQQQPQQQFLQQQQQQQQQLLQQQQQPQQQLQATAQQLQHEQAQLMQQQPQLMQQQPQLMQQQPQLMQQQPQLMQQQQQQQLFQQPQLMQQQQQQQHQQVPQQQQQPLLLQQQQPLPQHQQQQQMPQQQLPQQLQPMPPQPPSQPPVLQVQPFPQAWAAPPSWSAQERQVPAPEDEHGRSMLSTSARRRLRRQRAAQRRPASQESQSEGHVTPPSPEESTPSSESAGEHTSDDDLPMGSFGGSRTPMILDIRGSVARLSFDRHGCRIVQDVLAQAEQPVAAKLVAELHGRVREAMASPHANYVLQGVITTLPLCLSGFIITELLGFGAKAAKHRYGCRILSRLIEHAGSREEMAPLLDEVLVEAAEFCRHPFAHHVVECAVEHVPERRKQIAHALCISAKGNACHRCASHVVEAVLLHSKEEQKEQMVASLRRGEGLSMLARHPYGCFVVKAILCLPSHLSEEARREVANEATVIGTSRYGQRLLMDLGMA